LQRKSLAGLLALLETNKRRELEGQLEALVVTLSELDAAVVEVRGDRAEMSFPSGIRLILRRQSGAWRIEDVQ
jgi:hypothetical protein